MDHVGLFAVAFQLRCESLAKKIADRIDSTVARNPCDVRGRFDSQHRHSCEFIVLQEITVIAGNFDNQAVLLKDTRLRDPSRERRSVLQHRVGIRGKV